MSQRVKRAALILVALVCLALASCVRPTPTPRPNPQTAVYTVYLPVTQSIKLPPVQGIGSTYGDCTKIARIAPSGWAYNWTMDPPRCAGVEAVAMIWDEKTLGQIPVGVDVVLWFNEPDQYLQANMTPQEAAALWNQYRPLYGDFRNGSPAISDCDWMRDWLELVDTQPDFLCIHIYESQCDLAEAKRRFLIHLSRAVDLSNESGLPIWLTEYAWVSDSPDVPAFITWSKQQIAAHPEIERFAWFEDYYEGGEWWALPINTSLTNQAGELNALGRAYRD